LSIKFVARIVACFVLAGVFSSLSRAQQTTPSNDGSTAQRPSDQSSPAETPSNQTPSTQTPSTQTPAQGQAAPSSQPPPPSPQSEKDKQGQDASGQGKVAGTSNDRLFYALPNFLTLEKGANLPPLTAKEKFKVVARGTFDPVQFPWWGAIAAISQAEDSEPGYGQGWLGYAKRYGATAGDSTIENFMVGAVYPSILHQDPRFYYSPKGGFIRRTGYAISRIVVTRSDSGHAQFNFSEILGSATAAAISTNTYHPKGTYISTPANPHLFIASDRTLLNTTGVWGTQVGLDTITIVIKEFWPDVHHRMAKKQSSDAASNGPSKP
jgi:hypothetical protein